MFQLIKKDLLVALKIKSIKTAIFTFIIVLVLLPAFSSMYPAILPIIITYIVVMNSFYYDSLNNSESYILCMPNKREDVVYSKYILVTLVLILSNVLSYLFFGINILITSRLMVLQDTIVSLYSIIISFIIIIPLVFKLGYKVVRIIGPIITIIISYSFVIKYDYLIMGYGLQNAFLMNISNKIGVFFAKYFNLITHDYASRAMSIYKVLVFLIIVFIFLLSMFISFKTYKNKDIA